MPRNSSSRPLWSTILFSFLLLIFLPGCGDKKDDSKAPENQGVGSSGADSLEPEENP